MDKTVVSEKNKKLIKKRKFNNKPDETLLAEIVGIDGSHWQLCLRSLDRKSTEWEALQELADNSDGVNPFYEPSFLVALRGKISRTNESHLILFEGTDEKKIIKLAFPVIEIETSKGRLHLKAFENDYAPLSTPLVRKKDADETVLRFTELLASAVEEQKISMQIQTLSDDSLFAKSFKKHSKEFPQLHCSIEPSFTRAALLPEKKNKGGLSNLTSKKKREITRLEKKLGELGDLKFESVTNRMDILLRFEEFLLLEMKGWKGRKGTSMQLLKKTSAFARMAVTDLAKLEKAEIFSLRLDDRSIATIICFNVDGRYYPWKTTYDEDFAHRSPGSILMVALSREILSRSNFKEADSLGPSGESWMSSIWNSDKSFSKVVVGPDFNEVKAISKSGKYKAMAKRWIKKVLKIS